MASSLERFQAKVDVASSDDCWQWLGYIDGKGYGRFSLDKRVQYAHRAAYQLMVGAIPDGLTLDHLCRNRSCVNPAHLEPVSGAENTRRGVQPSSLKTSCVNGHAYDEANTYRDRNGRRKCRACNRNAVRRYEKRQRR